MNKIYLLTLIVGCISLNINAKTYRCTDAQGNPVYSEQPQGKSCQALDNIGGQFSVTPTLPVGTVDSTTNDSSADDNDHKKRLRIAKQNLAEAKQALEDGKKVRNGNERNYVKYQERIQKLEEAVATRQEELNELQ